VEYANKLSGRTDGQPENLMPNHGSIVCHCNFYARW